MKYLMLALVLVCGVLGTKRLYEWREYVNDRAWKAELAFEYLAAPIMQEPPSKQFPQGRIISRAEALDAMIKGSVK